VNFRYDQLLQQLLRAAIILQHLKPCLPHFVTPLLIR
jgi:hypothetical protein